MIFFFLSHTHINSFFSLFCPAKNIYTHMVWVFWAQVFPQFVKLIEKKIPIVPSNFQCEKKLAYLYVTQKLIDSICVSLSFKRIKQKGLCVCVSFFPHYFA